MNFNFILILYLYVNCSGKLLGWASIIINVDDVHSDDEASAYSGTMFICRKKYIVNGREKQQQ